LLFILEQFKAAITDSGEFVKTVVNHRKCLSSAVIFQRSNFQILQLTFVLAFLRWVGYSSVINKLLCISN